MSKGYFQSLVQNLGDAISLSISDSDRITAVIKEIKEAGYDSFLILEATIVFTKRDDGERSQDFDGPTNTTTTPVSSVRFTEQDERFLSALRIKDEDPA